MELGIAGRTAVVTASSQGLGLACARSLAREGARVVLNGRDAAKLRAVADRLRSELDAAPIRAVAADVSTTDGRSAILEAVPDADILVTNNAGPAPGTLQDWDEAALIGAFSANTIPAVQLIRAYLPGMQRRRFGRIVNITSAMVKAPQYALGLSTAARAALTAIAKAISIEAAADGVTINNLLPERFDTARQEVMAQRLMDEHGIDRDEAMRRIASGVRAGRLGRPEELGDACAYLCSAQAGYISGQNLSLDGGTYPGLV